MAAEALCGESCNVPRMQKAHPSRPHLYAWRRHFDRSQDWLAEAIGKSQSSVQRAEKGLAGVDDATFAAIADAYGITVAELSAPPGEARKAKRLHEIYEALRKLDGPALDTLADLAKQLSRQ